MLQNSKTSFGSVSRILHWSTALAVLAALPLGIWVAEMEVSLASIKYFGIHKSIGFSVLVLSVLRILWHLASRPPKVLEHGGWQDRVAKGVHRAFYFCLLLMPLSGWIASSATGIDTVIFNLWTLPNIAPVSERIETVGFAIHGILGLLMFVLIGLHVVGALYRSLVMKDRTLARMLRG